MSFDGIQIVGSRRLMATFREFPRRVQKTAVRRAVNFGATPIVRAARKLAPKESGLTKKAMNKRVVTYQDTVIAVIGVRKDDAGEYHGRRRVPNNYQHLIHDGHVARDGSFVPGTKYLKRAWEQGLPEAQLRMRQRLAEEIRKQAAKHR